MRNVEMKVEGSKLVITCDLEADQVPSSTGKTLAARLLPLRIVASTEGNQSVPGRPTYKLGLNLYTKN